MDVSNDLLQLLVLVANGEKMVMNAEHAINDVVFLAESSFQFGVVVEKDVVDQTILDEVSDVYACAEFSVAETENLFTNVDCSSQFLELDPMFEEIHKQCVSDVNQVLSELHIKSTTEELLGVLVHNLISLIYKEHYGIGEKMCSTEKEVGICKLHVEQQLELCVLSERQCDPGGLKSFLTQG